MGIGMVLAKELDGGAPMPSTSKRRSRHYGIPLFVALLPVATVAACTTAIVGHRDFSPAGRTVAVDDARSHTGRGARYSVPPQAVDQRSAVLLYSLGAQVIDPQETESLRARRVEIRVHVGMRNGEARPVVMELDEIVLVTDSPDGGATLNPTRIIRTPTTDSPVGGEVPPRSSAAWELTLALPLGDDPLETIDEFALHWAYRLDDQRYQAKTLFLKSRGREDYVRHRRYYGYGYYAYGYPFHHGYRYGGFHYGGHHYHQPHYYRPHYGSHGRHARRHARRHRR